MEGTARFTVRLHRDDLDLLKEPGSLGLETRRTRGGIPLSFLSRCDAVAVAWWRQISAPIDARRETKFDLLEEKPRSYDPRKQTLHRSNRIEYLQRRAAKTQVLRNHGRVVQLIGLVIESEGPLVAVGEICRIESARHDGSTLAEVVGFRDHHVLLRHAGKVAGISIPGAKSSPLEPLLRVPVGEALKGRVIDGLGNPLDERGSIDTGEQVSLNFQPPHPLKLTPHHRSLFRPASKPLERTFIPCGRGQRLGIFAGSGVGKSTLLGMIASRAEADVNVIALIGERGREVREFIEKDLDEAGRRKSVVVVATSNQPALARLKGAFVAMSIAEHFRDQGQNVLLMMDSVTRFAMAQREIGLAVGEPPTTRGYTPSVFSLLPQLLERAGSGEKGSITGTTVVSGGQVDRNDLSPTKCAPFYATGPHSIDTRTRDAKPLPGHRRAGEREPVDAGRLAGTAKVYPRRRANRSPRTGATRI